MASHAGALVQRVTREARAIGPREGARLLRDAFAENDLLTYASAISFKLFFTAIPLLLFVLGVLGGSGLTTVWTDDVAPELQRSVSPAAFTVLDDTVRQVLEQRQLFWLTAGALLTVWEMSGAIRAVMGVLNRIYDVDDDRTFVERMRTSVLLAAAVIALLLVTGAVFAAAPRLIDGGVIGPLTDVLRWPVALLLLLGVVALVVGVAPAERPRGERVTVGATLAVVAWLVTAAAFSWYLTSVADYGSIFGALATIVVALTYLSLSATAFLVGVQLDALVRERATP